MQRRQYLGALGALGLAGSATPALSAADSDAGPTAIGKDDDAQSIIENAGPNSWFLVEPGTTHEIDPPLDIPAKTVLDGGADARSPWDTTFEKTSGGTLATIGQQTTIRGIHFDGHFNGGDGLVDRNWNQPQIRLVGVTVRRMGGDARVHNTPNRWVYHDVRLVNNGGYGIRNISTDHDGPRRGVYMRGAIAYNDEGGILSDGTHERDNFYYTTWRSNGGPAYTYDSGGNPSRNVRIYGNMRYNDGPGIYIKSGSVQGWDLGAYVANNNRDIATAGVNHIHSNPVGSVIHSETADGRSQVTASSGPWRPGAAGDCLVAARGGDASPLTLTVSGTEARGGSIFGRVAVSILDAAAFDVDWSGALAGVGLDPFEGVVRR
jgi:hypothetical protein